jgi:glycerophosphoryl diester phosphodiesterase
VANLIEQHPAWRDALWAVYGGAPPTERALARLHQARGYTGRSLVRCGLTYLAVGWSGHVPASCHKTILVLPSNAAPFFWGWPHRLTERLRAHGSEVILTGAVGIGHWGQRGIDDVASFDDAVPAGFDGYVWTNRIELIGPHLRKRSTDVP